MSLYLTSQMLTSPESVNLLNGLMAYWSLESDSTDSVGPSNGTDTGITYASAKVGNGATGYNGTTDKIIISDTSAIKPTSALSISLWVKRESNGENRLFNVGWENYPTALSGIVLNLDGANKISFAVGNNTGYTPGTHYGSLQTTDTVTISTWTHVVATWDGSVMKIYLNAGTPDSVAWTGGCVYHGTTVRAGIGHAHTTVFGGDDLREFTGDLDEVGLWNRALNATEVATLYNGGAGRAYPNFYAIPAYTGSYSTLGTYDNTAATYVGTWSTLTGQPLIYNGTLHRSQTTGDMCQFGVDTTGGTGNIRLISKIQPDAGSMDVYVDGVFILRHDQWGGTVSTWVDQYDLNIGTFSVGQHVVTLRINGRPNPYSQTPWVSVDGFKVL